MLAAVPRQSRVGGFGRSAIMAISLADARRGAAQEATRRARAPTSLIRNCSFGLRTPRYIEI